MALDSYLKLIKIYETKDKKEPQKHYGLEVLGAAQNGYSIASQIKYKVDKIKSELRRLVNTFNFESSSSYALRANLIELMLNLIVLLSPLLNEYPRYSECGKYLPVGSSSPSLPLNDSMHPHSSGTSSYLHSLLAPSQPTSEPNEVLQRRGRTWVESLKGSIR